MKNQNLYMKNGCFTKHPVKKTVVWGFQVYINQLMKSRQQFATPQTPGE